MTVSLNDDMIVLAGECGIEEVETLVVHLESHPEFRLDVSEATSIHTALWQALMVFKPKIIAATTTSPAVNGLLQDLRIYLDETRQAED